MKRNSWDKFLKARKRFRQAVDELSGSLPELKKIQQKFVDSRSETSYTIETPVVYNSALDDITIDDEIKLILVADNPGRREQAAENKRYLVGPSGKIAARFFLDNPVLGINFFKNVIILNKTPVHSPRTGDLRELCCLKNTPKRHHTKAQRHKKHEENNRGDKGDAALSTALEESQRTMAALLLEFHEALDCPVWITGYSEMRKGGIFEEYTKTLKELYADKQEMYKQVFIFRHFSMNQFTIDLKKQAIPGESAAKSLRRIGTAYRERIL